MKTEVKYDSRFGIVKLDFPMFHYDLDDGSTGRYQRDVQEMFVIRWHFEIVLPNSLFRIPFFTFSQSKHVFNLFNSHVSFNKKGFIRLLVTFPQSCNYAYSWGIISTENSSCKFIKCHYIKVWKLEIVNMLALYVSRQLKTNKAQ